MQPLDWNDLRHLLALGRAGSLSGAARLLGVDPTTVSRRLRVMEQGLDVRLFERVGDALRLTEAGERAIHHAETVEAAVGDLTAAVEGSAGAVTGTVRLTAVPLLAAHVLAPASPQLAADHPGLRLEVIAEPRDLSLGRREADMALRLARPGKEAEGHLLARRLGSLDYAVYVAAGSDDPRPPWVSYDEAMAHLPQALWVADAVRRGDALASIAFNDATSLMRAVEAGLGRALLPRLVADRSVSLKRLDDDRPLPQRELWLLTHPEQRHLPRIAAVADWLERILRT